MSGDEYMALLLDRQQRWRAANPGGPEWLRPPLTAFVQPGDEDLFTPPAPAPAPKRKPAPRTYLPASYWQRLRDKAQAELDALIAATDAATHSDYAAAGGESIGRTRQDRYHQRIDRLMARGSLLQKRIARLDYKITRARAREAQQ